MLEFREVQNGVELLKNGKSIFEIKVGSRPVCVGFGKNEYKMSHGSFKIKEKASKPLPVVINSVELIDDRVIANSDEGSFTLSVLRGCHLNVKVSGFDNYNRLYIELPAEKDEHIYGTGEIFSEFDLRGKRVNCFVAEHINALQVGKKIVKQVFGLRDSQRKQKFSNYETYYAQPTFLSSKKYYFHSFATARTQFDFIKAERHLITVDEIADFCFGFGEAFEDVVSDLSLTLGRQPELPDWVFNGEILGVQGGSETMMKKVDTALNHDMAVAGVWIQDWEGRRVTAVGKQLYWNWEHDSELYPELPSKIKELNEKGIKVLGYCNTFLAVEKPLYKEASEKGYCVKNKNGDDYYVTITTFPAAIVDLTNPDACRWLKDIIKKNMIDFGFSGWMADFGEYLPTDAVLFSGEDAELVHNTWPARWARLNREAVEEAGKLGEIMFFTRAGFSETPKYSTMMWNGDNHVDFSIDFGLPSVIPAMLSLTCCGFGLSHSDIGGYTTFFNLKRSEELFMRWCEMNAFSPVLRGHEGLNPDLNAQFDSSEEVLSHGRKFSNIYKSLKPYLKEAVRYNFEKGVGVVRPLFFYYDEEKAYTECYEYLLGRDILVSPVIRPKASSKKVYLPNDTWIHLWSGKEYTGGEYEIPAPIGEIPVFIRKDSTFKNEFIKLKNI